MNRERILLKATYDLLKQQKDSPYILDILCTTAIWDDVECDGYCLMEEIAELLGIKED